MVTRAPGTGILDFLNEIDTAAEYLTETLDNREVPAFAFALRNTIEAHGGLRAVLNRAEVDDETRDRLLSGEPILALADLVPVLQGLGLKITIKPTTE